MRHCSIVGSTVPMARTTAKCWHSLLVFWNAVTVDKWRLWLKIADYRSYVVPLGQRTRCDDVRLVRTGLNWFRLKSPLDHRRGSQIRT